jgi:hypothetical protein
MTSLAPLAIDIHSFKPHRSPETKSHRAYRTPQICSEQGVTTKINNLPVMPRRIVDRLRQKLFCSHQTQMLYKRRKVFIRKQQLMAIFNAESRNHHIYCLPHRDPFLA